MAMKTIDYNFLKTIFISSKEAELGRIFCSIYPKWWELRIGSFPDFG